MIIYFINIKKFKNQLSTASVINGNGSSRLRNPASLAPSWPAGVDLHGASIPQVNLHNLAGIGRFPVPMNTSGNFSTPGLNFCFSMYISRHFHFPDFMDPLGISNWDPQYLANLLMLQELTKKICESFRKHLFHLSYCFHLN